MHFRKRRACIQNSFVADSGGQKGHGRIVCVYRLGEQCGSSVQLVLVHSFGLYDWLDELLGLTANIIYIV